MNVYRPYQHVAQPQGCTHRTIYASIELWTDDMPEAIEIGGILWKSCATKEQSDNKELEEKNRTNYLHKQNYAI